MSIRITDNPYDFLVAEMTKSGDILSCKKCGWSGVSKYHATVRCIPVLEEVADDRNGRVKLRLGAKVDTPIGVGTVVNVPPGRVPAGRVVEVRLYCSGRVDGGRCKRYLLGYFTSTSVGSFQTKQGMCDLRNEEYRCDDHATH